MANNNREIRESKGFERKKASFGDVRRLDEALDGFIWMVSRDPTAFPQIDSDSRVRIAEVGPLFDAEGLLFSFMILFRIESDDCVELLWIEATKM